MKPIKRINTDNKISAQEIKDLEKGQFFIVRVVYREGEKRNFFEQVVSKKREKGILTVVRFVIQNHHVPDINALNSAKVRNEFEFEIEKVKFCDEIKNNIQLVKVFGKLVNRKKLPFFLHGFTAGEEREIVFEGMKSDFRVKRPSFTKIKPLKGKELFFVNLHRDNSMEETIIKLRENGPNTVWKAKVGFIGKNFINVQIVGEKPIRTLRPPFEYLGLKIGMRPIEIEVITPKKEDKENFILPLSFLQTGPRVLFYIDPDQEKSKLICQQSILKNAKHKELLSAKILELFMSKNKENTAIALLRILGPAEIKAKADAA